MGNCKRLAGLVLAIDLGLVVCCARGTEYQFVPGGANDWWMTATNWNPNGVPNSVNDVVVFDASAAPGYTTNVHSAYYVIQEMRFATTSTWNVHNARQDPTLQAPSGNALVTQNGSGAVTFGTDLRFLSNTVFGGTGTGNITVNGSTDAGAYNFKETVRGPGGLTMQGNYTLTINAPVSYQGATTINAGTVLFNGDSLKPGPGWTEGADVTPYGYVPADLAPITVNSGAKLGGIGTLRADATVNAGASFLPGSPASTPSAKTMTLNNLTLASGSATGIDLGGATPGNGTGYYDQVTVVNQLSLGGTLTVSLVGAYVPPIDTVYTIFRYGTLNPIANAFSAVNTPAIPPNHPNWSWNIDYGTGTNSQVTLNYQANPWYFTAGSYDTLPPGSQNPWWATTANWSYNGKPGFDSANPDVVIFDDAHYSAAALAALGNHQTNIHDVGPGWLKEIQVNTSSSWWFYNNNRTLAMKNPVAGQQARFMQNGSGTVTVDDNLQLDSTTLFGGSGTGTVTVNGQQQACNSSTGPRSGIYGTGGVVLDGNYTLVFNNVTNYQGTTTINRGTLLFNAETLRVNPSWVDGQPSTYYLPSTQGAVTVNAGGTLGGTGKLHAPVEIASGGILAPGTSAGVFTVDSLTLDPGSLTRMELGGATPGNGAGFHDQVVVSGALSLAGTLDVALLGGFQPAFGQSFVLFRYGSLDPQHSTFDALIAPAGPWGNFIIDYGSGTNSQITLTAVPEPAGALLMVFGAGLAWWRRKRS